MASKGPGLVSMEMPSRTVAPGNDSILTAPASYLARGNQEPTRDELYVSNRLRRDIAIQRATAIKEEHAAYLAQLITQRAVIRFAEYVEFDREIMDRPRANADDQADVVNVCSTMRQMEANTLLAMRQGAVNQLEETVLTPLDPPEDKGDDVIIEQTPGFLGRFFGGQTVTRVKR